MNACGDQESVKAGLSATTQGRTPGEWESILAGLEAHLKTHGNDSPEAAWMRRMLALEQRTAALEAEAQRRRAATEELARFNRAAVGREMRIIELKNEVNELCARLGEAARYSSKQEPAPPDPALSRPPAAANADLAPLESILCTEELHRRPARPPQYEAEHGALMALIQALADSPRTILQVLADKVLEVLQADSAGLSLLTDTGERFYWAAIAGMWKPHSGGGTPRNFGPCGDVLDREKPLLFTHWERRYPYLTEATPLAEEGLLVPFFVRGKAVGTIWAIAHRPDRRFDAEDLRLLESLGRFASAAHQAVEALSFFDQRQAALSLLEDSRRMQEKLRENEQQLETITSNMPAAVTRCSRDFRYLWASGAYARWLGKPQSDIAGRSIREVIGPQGFEEIRPYMERVLTGERVEYTAEVHFLGAGNRWIHATYIPTRAADQLVDGWIAVVSDITEQVQQEKRLRETNQRLARANEDLSHFAFAASHDLQEPLRMIAAYSQLLIKGYPGPVGEEASACIRFITDGTTRMQQLLTGLLAYTRLIGKGEEPAVSTVDLGSAFRKALENCRTGIEESHASITSDPLPAVEGYEPHFVELFQNLIGNALKYRSQQPPRVHVSAAVVDGAWRLAVSDNGIGIEPEFHQQIFGVFKRLHGRNIPGTGIGLAICQRIVERYGGRIWVESEKDRGATFYFTLPAAQGVFVHER